MSDHVPPTAEPLTRERARKIWKACRNEYMACDNLHKAEDAAADRLIELLGPQPKRKVTRVELEAAYKAACFANETECCFACEFARRLGLEVGDV